MIQATRRGKGGRSALLLTGVLALAAAVAVAVLVASGRSAEASFPGNNGLLAFSGPDSNGDFEIFTSKLDGSSLKQRTNAEGSSTQPKWSPDGTKIAFSSDRDGHDSEIYVKDITTGKVSQLTDNFEIVDDWGNVRPLSDLDPAWSPDGSKIAFVRVAWDEEGGWFCPAIWVMDSDGSDVKQLTRCRDYEGASQFRPEWSPDGSKIAFLRNLCPDEGCLPDIWVMKPDGSEQRNLTNSSENEREFDWKPNGKKIVYSRRVIYDPCCEVPRGNIFKMNADGSQKDRLTFSSTDESSPVWSPNGRKIIFFRFDWVEGGHFVIKMNTDGTNKTILPDGAVTGDWQPIPTP
jgi:Tol biopolymer transport system component